MDMTQPNNVELMRLSISVVVMRFNAARTVFVLFCTGSALDVTNTDRILYCLVRCALYRVLLGRFVSLMLRHLCGKLWLLDALQ